MVLIDSYSEANKDGRRILNTLHPSAAGNLKSACGQSFTMLGSNHKITSVKFYLRKNNSPIGNAHAVLYAHSGTYGTDSEPTGVALATSDDFDVSTLTTSFVLYELTFTGAQQYEMQADTYYCIVFENPTTGTIDASNKIQVGTDAISPSHDGNEFNFSNGNWWGTSDRDACFYVYGELSVPPEGWTGKIVGVTDPAKIMGIPAADIAKVVGVA